MSEKRHQRASKIMTARGFVFSKRKPRGEINLPAISLFSGAGLSDLGYEAAGFSFLVQAEKDADRAELCSSNFGKNRCIVGELARTWEQVVAQYRLSTSERPFLVSVTPPCQGMSSSNPGRGKVAEAHTSDERNLLLLDAIPVIKALTPRIIVVENVPQLLNRMVKYGEEEAKVYDLFKRQLGECYRLFTKVTQMADYGIPQDRRRAVLVAVDVKEPWLTKIEGKGLLPFPRPTYAREANNGLKPWITLKRWFTQFHYPILDAQSPEAARSKNDPLHFVPDYEGDRYLMVADIPAKSGQSAYQNPKCHTCSREDVPEKLSYCPYCKAPMRNRPYVMEHDGTFRLIKGFDSSYRRMYPDRPAATITTSSSHIGSDNKIHPWENRVLSIRECADLQTVPRFYDWSWCLRNDHTYVIRQVIGEALPPWFSYQHGLVLRKLLLNTEDIARLCVDSKVNKDDE